MPWIVQVILALPSIISALMKSYSAISAMEDGAKAEAHAAVAAAIDQHGVVAADLQSRVNQGQEAVKTQISASESDADKKANDISAASVEVVPPSVQL